MMTQDRDYEDALRRALTAAAESIEPAGDGLHRIRHRLDSPRSARSVLSGCADWLELRGTRFLVRLEPVTEAARAALRRSGPLLALISFLRRLLSPQAARRAGGHRGAGRLGPAGPWLKPVFAVSAAVAIVVVGVVILNHETGTLINPANGSYGSASPGSSRTGGGTTANSKRWKLPLGVNPSPSPTGPGERKSVKTLLPAPACTPTPSPSAATTAPAGGATATPTATPSATGTATGTPPTPSPSDTAQPTPTPTSSTATGGTTAATTTAAFRPDDAGAPGIVECGGKVPKT